MLHSVWYGQSRPLLMHHKDLSEITRFFPCFFHSFSQFFAIQCQESQLPLSAKFAKSKTVTLTCWKEVRKKRGNQLVVYLTLCQVASLYPFTCSKYVTTGLVKFDTILESLCGIHKIQMLGICQGNHAAQQVGTFVGVECKISCNFFY